MEDSFREFIANWARLHGTETVHGATYAKQDYGLVLRRDERAKGIVLNPDDVDKDNRIAEFTVVSTPARGIPSIWVMPPKAKDDATEGGPTPG